MSALAREYPDQPERWGGAASSGAVVAMDYDSEPCKRCAGEGVVAVASVHVGDGAYNDEWGDCPRCHGTGEES